MSLSDDIIAQYPLINCTIFDSVFDNGLVTFAQLAIELHLVFTAQDENGTETGGEPATTEVSLMPLVISYESLLSIKVPGKKYIQLSSPTDIVESWAAMNQLEFPQGTLDAVHATPITLNLELDFISEIWTDVAPTISANRRARSSSRWSATELLPLKSFTVALGSQAPSVLGAVDLPAPPAEPLPHVQTSEPTVHHSEMGANHHAEDVNPTQSSQQEEPTTDVLCMKPPVEGEHAPAASIAVEPHLLTNGGSNPDMSGGGGLARDLDPQHLFTPNNNLLHTPEEAAIRLPRRAIRRRETPSSASLPSSIVESPQTTCGKPARRVILDESSLHRISSRIVSIADELAVAKISTPAAVRTSGKSAKRASLSHLDKRGVDKPEVDLSDDDVPLGVLVRSVAATTSAAAVSKPAPRNSIAGESAKYDFCDLSSPNDVKVLPSRDASLKRVSTSSKGKRVSGRSSGGLTSRSSGGSNASRKQSSTNRSSKIKNDACKPPPLSADPEVHQKKAIRVADPADLVPAVPLPEPSKPSRVSASIAQHLQYPDVTEKVHPSGEENDDPRPCLHRGLSRVRMPTPSLARPSMARGIEKSVPRGSTLVSNNDADATSLKKLLDSGLGEDNLEEFIKSATRLGKRVKQAKRQREESMAGTNSADMIELARCATELLHICAEERDDRRLKYFRYFTKRVASLVEQASALDKTLSAAQTEREVLHTNLRALMDTLAADQVSWDAIERGDVEAAIASIHDKLVVRSSSH